MRISYWSSDVCSSDLWSTNEFLAPWSVRNDFDHRFRYFDWPTICHPTLPSRLIPSNFCASPPCSPSPSGRSEERGVGTECVGTCSSRWSPYHYNKNRLKQQIDMCE